MYLAEWAISLGYLLEHLDEIVRHICHLVVAHGRKYRKRDHGLKRSFCFLKVTEESDPPPVVLVHVWWEPVHRRFNSSLMQVLNHDISSRAHVSTSQPDNVKVPGVASVGQLLRTL